LSDYLCGNLCEITEQIGYIAYRLNDNSYFYNTVFQILKRNNEGCFIRPFKVDFNGRTELVYDTEGLLSMEKFFKNARTGDGMAVLEELLAKLFEVESGRFIQMETVDITERHLFVTREGHVRIITVPMSIMSTYDTKRMFYDQLKAVMNWLIDSASFLKDDYVNRLQADLRNRDVSPEEIYSHFKNKKYGINNRGSGILTQQSFVLRSRNPALYGDIPVTSKKLVIGKSQKRSDVVIRAFDSISRSHCELILSDGVVYVNDLSSTNGTFINGRQIPPNTYTRISPGDEIAIADAIYTLEGGTDR